MRSRRLGGVGVFMFRSFGRRRGDFWEFSGNFLRSGLYSV